MKRTWMVWGASLALAGVIHYGALAQQSQTGQSSTSRSGSQSTSSNQSQQGSQSRQGSQSQNRSQSQQSGQSQQGNQSQRSNQYPDAEARLRYDGERNRLSIDVDEDIRFQPGNQRRSWTEDGQLDLRYDRDRNRLSGDIGGSLRLNRVASDMGSWWQSWWEDERQARRSSNEGAESGAQEFIRQHDQNRDGYLTRQEIPQRMRDDFASVDRDNDGYLTRSEVRYYGHLMYDTRNRSNADRRYADSGSRNQDEQTWSEWWSSWWDDDTSGQSREQGTSSAARQFVRQHDDNDDGYVSRSEMPARMRSDFNRVDSDGDGYLSLSEIRQHGTPTYGAARQGSGRASSRGLARDSRGRGYDGEQSWSEWWSSFWSDEERSGSAEQIAAEGANEFLRRHDDNGDGQLVRSELPSRMYDEFNQIDRDANRYLSRSEIQQHAAQTRTSRDRSSGRQASYGRDRVMSDNLERMSGSQSPRETAYVWIIDANQGHVSAEDLQDAYRLLAKIDTDGDGELSSSELKQRRQEVVKEFCENCFEQLDQDNDGYLSRSEASGSVFATRFQQFDEDDDDYLTKSEIQQTLEDRFETARSRSDDESETR